MRRTLLAVLPVVIAGCALPRYETRLVPIVASPSTSESQAVAICRPGATGYGECAGACSSPN
jgi:hypothetical protein